MDRLSHSRISIPGRLGVAGMNLPTTDTILSGMAESTQSIGSLALDLLVGMIQRGERGRPESLITTFVRGFWHEGATLKRTIRAGSP